MNRSKKKREIKYQKLYECSLLEQDDYWKQIFENLSRGKSIKKCILNDGSIEIVNKNKNFVYVYKDKSPELILQECKELIRQKLHLHSKKDIYNNQHLWSTEQNELNTLTQQDDWKKIRNKNMRYFLLMKYAISVKNKRNISWKTANTFFKTITDALYLLHTHKSIDITMENGVIADIKDIIIDENYIVQNNRIDVEQSKKKDKKDVKLTLWDKYLNNITKMYTESKIDQSILLSTKLSLDEDVQFISNHDDEYDEYETIF